MSKTVEYIWVFHPSDDSYTFFDENNTKYYYHRPSNNMTEYVSVTSTGKLTGNFDCSTITKDEWLRFKNKMSLIATSIRASLPEDCRNERLVHMPSVDRKHMLTVRTIDDTFIVKRFLILKEDIYDNVIPYDPVLEERIDRYFNELLKGMRVFINKLNR